jgi:3-oxoacyl-ACP reductase-like protein
MEPAKRLGSEAEGKAWLDAAAWAYAQRVGIFPLAAVVAVLLEVHLEELSWTAWHEILYEKKGLAQDFTCIYSSLSLGKGITLFSLPLKLTAN